MKGLIKTAMTVLLAVVAVACTSDEEQPVSESRGTVSVSINGIINGYTPQDATRATAQNVVRIMWDGNETVYVFEGRTCLGSLTATKGDDAGTYAKLSGTINSPTPGKTLTLVYSPQFGEAPTVNNGKLSLDLSTQADGEVPFLIYATMPAPEAAEVSDASVRFDLATSIYKCNCTGLEAEGDITQAVIGEVNTVCELMLSDDGTPTVSGTTPGSITRTAGFKAADQRAIFSVAVVKTDAATARTIEITKDGKLFTAAFDKGALGTAAAYNTVCVLSEKTSATTGEAEITGGIKVKWVQLWAGGPKFAEYNVGAENKKAEDYGGYYTWGGTYKNGDGITWNDDHNTSNTGSGDLSGADDTATKLWGSAWRMPTSVELEALINSTNCTVEWIDGTNKKYNNTTVKGLLCTGKGAYASNSVFLPAAGLCNDGGFYGQGDYGYYWSSTPNGSNYAYRLFFESGNQSVRNNYRDRGYSVRAVLAK